MIFNAKNNFLMVYDFSGVHAHFLVDSLESIRIALSAEGGTINLKAIWLDFKRQYLYLIEYRTLCGKIYIQYELSRLAYYSNSDFFGDDSVTYESPITFTLDNDKFGMP